MQPNASDYLDTNTATKLEVPGNTCVDGFCIFFCNGDFLGDGTVTEADTGGIGIPLGDHIIATGGGGVGAGIAGGGGQSLILDEGKGSIVGLNGFVVVQCQNLIGRGARSE